MPAIRRERPLIPGPAALETREGHCGRKVVWDAAGTVISQECATCRQVLPASAFSRSRHISTGIYAECKRCAAIRHRDRYHTDPIPSIVSAVNTRSKKKGIHCDLTVKDVRAALEDQADRCFYTGLPFGEIGGKDTMSIDRIDPTRGYTRNNIVLCHRWVNMMKLDHPVGDFIAKVLTVARNINTLQSDPKIQAHLGEYKTRPTDRDWTADAIEAAISAESAAVAKLTDIERNLATVTVERDRLTKDLTGANAQITHLTEVVATLRAQVTDKERNLADALTRVIALESDITAMSNGISGGLKFPDQKLHPPLLRLSTTQDTIVQIHRW